jgi:hypothetical protein
MRVLSLETALTAMGVRVLALHVPAARPAVT